MQEVQLVCGGKSYRGGILCDEAEWMDVCLFQPAFFRRGDEVTVRGFNYKKTMRIVHTDKYKVMLIPAEADVFKIYSEQYSEESVCFVEGERATTSYKLNAFASLSNQMQSHPVRVVDVSRMGLGFVSNDLSIQFHSLYNASIALDQTVIAPTLVVKHAHFMEKTVRFSAEIRWVSQYDLQELRYHLAMKVKQQFQHSQAISTL